MKDSRKTHRKLMIDYSREIYPEMPTSLRGVYFNDARIHLAFYRSQSQGLTYIQALERLVLELAAKHKEELDEAVQRFLSLPVYEPFGPEKKVDRNMDRGVDRNNCIPKPNQTKPNKQKKTTQTSVKP